MPKFFSIECNTVTINWLYAAMFQDVVSTMKQ